MVFMPDPVREAVHFTSCKHIASSLMVRTRVLPDPVSSPSCCLLCAQHLLLEGSKKLNLLSMANLHQDLQHLESFANRTTIPNLAETFSEVRQMLDLFLSGNLEAVLDEGVRAHKYPHLSTAKLKQIMTRSVHVFSLATFSVSGTD